MRGGQKGPFETVTHKGHDGLPELRTGIHRDKGDNLQPPERPRELRDLL